MVNLNNFRNNKIGNWTPQYTAVVFKVGSTCYAQDYRGNDLISARASADSTVIQAALDFCDSEGGGICHIKQGSYNIAVALAVPEYTTLEGEGWNTILTQAVDAGVHLITNKSHGAGPDEGIVIQNLNLNGNEANITSTAVDCINFDGALRAKILNCLIRNSCRFGIRMTGNGVALILGNKLSACVSTQISLTTDSDDSVIIGNDIGSGGAIGINLNGVANCYVSGNNVFLNTTHGIDISTGNRNQIIGNMVHDNVQNGIRVTASGSANSADLNSIVGNTLQGNNSGNSASFAEILITASAGIACENNVVTGNNITVTGSNDVGVKEVTGDINKTVITGNAIDIVSGTGCVIVGANTICRHNSEFITESKGTGSIANGATSSGNIAHGLSYTPAAGEFSIVWTEDPTNALTEWWISGIDATNFVINRNDPGASGADFSWSVRRV